MTDEFIRQRLSTSVAQICSNIGWHSMSNSTLQMMTDILYGYFKDLAQTVKKFSEIYKPSPDIDDVKIAFQDKDIAIPDIIKYLKQVGPIKSSYQLPKFPIPTKSNLNIMKPGSSEIVRRPICIHEHLPTIFPEQIEENNVQNDSNISQTPLHTNYSLGVLNDQHVKQTDVSNTDRPPPKENIIVHKKLREISSVVMTTSGFLSPSREGKLPESRLLPFPNFKFAQKPSTSPAVLPEVKNEHQRHKKILQKSHSIEKVKPIVESVNCNINDVKNDASNVKKIASVKETSKIKEIKTGVIGESNQKIKKTSKIKDKSKLNLLNTIFDKPLQHSKLSKNSSVDSVKLTTEPDRQKLNIFKKLSKNNDSSTGQQNSKLKNLTVSKPTSTIVSSDISIKPDSKPSEVNKDKSFKPVFFKQNTEKKQENFLKPIKDSKQVSNVSKKRKKKQTMKNNDYNPPIEPTNSNISTKKFKSKHEPDLFETPMKFSFFGQDVLPQSLASNPLVPKYTTPNSVLPILEKANSINDMMYLNLPGEVKFEFDDVPPTLASENEKIPSEKIKPKKEHKKIKKDKIKSKKKKDKKNRSERKKEKSLKKLKIKDKLNSDEIKSLDVVKEKKPDEPDESLVPIIKLKLPGSNKSNCSSLKRKIVIKPVVKNKSPLNCIDDSTKEKSPVKSSSTKHIDKSSTISLPQVPLTTNKEKEKEIENVSEPNPPKLKKSPVTENIDEPYSDIPVSTPLTTPNNKNKVKPAKKLKKTITQNRPAFYYDDAGNQVWICPTCGKQDDGSPMIGCDGCDAWFHWVCVGIQCPPDCAIWYCPTCLLKRANSNDKAKRGRPMKK